MMMKPALTIVLANPRGFCAGVDRAIQIVERTIDRHGAPVYVRHEIVHNRYVVEDLEAKGAIFVEELDQVPDGVPVIFSAHGVPKSVPKAAKARDLIYFDATCPLVSKVHLEAERHHRSGHHVILIGHEGHPEVIGTMGQLPDGAMTLIENSTQAKTASLPTDKPLAFTTQTTLSVDDTAEIIQILQARFPEITAPNKEDICYATTNRQSAVKAIARNCDAIAVIGAPNSSNSRRLVEVAAANGCDKAMLIGRADEIEWGWLDGISRLGLTAGASAPEILVKEVIDACQARFELTVTEVHMATENVHFKLPRSLMTK